MSYRVFISHGWHDRWVASQMHRLLAVRDVDAFIDIYDIEHGDRIAEAVKKGIDTSDELLCLITPWSVNRNWIWVEMGMMLAKNCRVTAVLYGITMAEIRDMHGGLTFLSDSNMADINGFDAYIDQVANRAAVVIGD
jgi:hypothetical protein